LKSQPIKYFTYLIIVLILSCSVKKDKWANRNFQALNTKYNVLFHGKEAFDKSLIDLKKQHKENFWEILPVEPMKVDPNEADDDEKKSKNFEKAEEKATKAIQKRSMNIKGKEKNFQIDEAYLLLGKSRYYDKRFLPALESFNYILYKYPESDKIYEAKVWREKTNMRLQNDGLAIKNLKKLFNNIDLKSAIYGEANATMAQAYLNLNKKDTALIYIKKAVNFIDSAEEYGNQKTSDKYLTKFKKAFTNRNEEKSRYRFILGQIYEDLNFKDSAYAAFQSVIDMRRKADRSFTMRAHAKQAQLSDYEHGDTVAFLKKYNKFLKNRENRPFLDLINHQVALFYDNLKNTKRAKTFYNNSLRKRGEDDYLAASNYRNLAKIYFDATNYKEAGKYYDSTLVLLNPKSKEFYRLKKKRKNLDDVIKYEAIAQNNDSILNVVAMSESERGSYYGKYIEKIKKIDFEKAEIERIKNINLEKEKNKQNSEIQTDNTSKGVRGIEAPKFGPKQSAAEANAFYFYNTTSVAYGKIEYKKRWGDRALKNNWRLSSASKGFQNTTSDTTSTAKSNDDETDTKPEKPEYDLKFYTDKLPKNQKAIDSLVKDRNYAYYQLGTIYSEKFKEYPLGAKKLEKLLEYKPQERLILPTMYNLYKIYEIIDKPKSLAMKDQIIAQYPNSRYAKIISNTAIGEELLKQSPEYVYKNLFANYEKGNLNEALADTNEAIDNFDGDEIVSKMEFLKATIIGKLEGVAEYKKALNDLALNYPNSSEGKEAEQILNADIPKLEQAEFNSEKPKSWNIVYCITKKDTTTVGKVTKAFNRYCKENFLEKFKVSRDIFSETDDFVTVHDITTEDYAKLMVQDIAKYKDTLFKKDAKTKKIKKQIVKFDLEDPYIIISNENYKVLYITKKIHKYLSLVDNTPTTIQTYRPSELPEQVVQTPEAVKDSIKKVEKEIKNNLASPKTGDKNPKIPEKIAPSTIDPRSLLPKEVQEAMKKRENKTVPSPARAIPNTNDPRNSVPKAVQDAMNTKQNEKKQ
jgi:tetratricopeptide (TPR) repeat protein